MLVHERTRPIHDFSWLMSRALSSHQCIDIVTGSPNGPVLFCWLTTVAVCRHHLSLSSPAMLPAVGPAGRIGSLRTLGQAHGRSDGRRCTAGQSCYIPLRRHLVDSATEMTVACENHYLIIPISALCCVVYNSCAQWYTHSQQFLHFCMLVGFRFLFVFI